MLTSRGFIGGLLLLWLLNKGEKNILIFECTLREYLTKMRIQDFTLPLYMALGNFPTIFYVLQL